MKQVIFAIALLAMASLTGCLTDDESSVDETTDTTSDNTGNTNDNSNDNSDTTSDNTGDTNDNSNDNTDSGDEGMIDPVGTDGGVTIPEDSSVFMDSGSIYQMGTTQCNDPQNGTEEEWSDDEEKFTCNFTYYQNDFFRSNYNSAGDLTSISYIDVDGIGNSLDFYGWVNKTGQTVTIEPLVYPDRGDYKNSNTYNADIDDDGSMETVPTLTKRTNQPVNSERCYEGYTCEIIFYGVNNLQYNAQFALGMQIGNSDYFAIDRDNDGIKDAVKQEIIYQTHTITFDLPFEPYGFEISPLYSEEQVYRIF